MTVIFAFSHQAHSGAVTEEYLGDYNVIVRKFSHVSEYLILCLLFYWNLSPASIVKNTGGFPGASRHPLILAALFTIIYAASDEWHQSFVPGRSASAFDVMVDCIGVVIASALLFAFCRLNFHENSMHEKRD